MKRINNIKIYEDLDNNALIKHICKKYHILYEDILDWHIIKKSIDARNKDNIHYLYNIAISFKSEKKYSKFDDYKKFELPNINIKNTMPGINDGLEKDIKKSIRILPSKDMEGFFVSKFIKK